MQRTPAALMERRGRSRQPLGLFLIAFLRVAAEAVSINGESITCHHAPCERAHAAETASGGCGQNEFASLTRAVSEAIVQLTNDMRQAEQQSPSLACDYENITLHVAELFLTYAEHDFKLSGRWSVQGENGVEVAEDKTLLCSELNRTLQRLAKARQELSRLVSNRSLHRRPIPSHRLLGCVERNGYFFTPGGRPVFAGGYDQGIWRWHYGFSTDAAFHQALALGQDSLEVAVSIASILPTADMQPNKSEIALLSSRLDFFQQAGVSAGLVLRCDLPDWALAAHPELALYAGSSCHQNIDEPHLASLWNLTLSAVYAPLSKHPALNSVRLGNEIWFSPYSNATVISQSTQEKWHAWLAHKYENIADLNKLYNTSFPSFDSIPIPMRVINNTAHPPLKDFSGTPSGYDLARFNMDRVADHYSSIVAVLKAINPDVITHIKIVDSTTFSAWPYGGTDRYELNEKTQWVGCDTRIMPSPSVQEPTPNRRTGQYALDWLAAALGYTWMSTTSPGKVVVDLEIHAIRTVRVTNTSISDSHMSAAIWTAHLHGLGLHLIWSWTRDETGQPTDGLLGSLNTQPQVMDDYARALSYINALAPEVHAIATRPRPVCVLWVDAAKTGNDKYFMFSLIDAFEALSFAGPSPGFLTASQITEHGVPDSCKALVIPVTEFATDKTVSVLHELYKADNVSMLLVGRANISAFSKTEMGLPRASSEISWLSKLPLIADQSPQSMRDELMPHVQDAVSGQSLLRCVDAASHQLVWGVLCRSAAAPDQSQHAIVALINVLEKPVSIAMVTAAGDPVVSVCELYMNETLHVSDGLVMQPLQVYILSVPLS